MSTIQTTRLPIAPGISARLATAEAARAELGARVAALALDEVLGLEGVAAKRQAMERELDEAVRLVGLLRHAERQALQRDQQSDADARLDRQHRQFAVLEGHAAARLEAATRLAASIEAAHREYVTVIETTRLMFNAPPEGTSLPDVILENLPGIVAGEMYRHCERPAGACLPGANPATFDLRDDPAATEPLTAVVARWNAWLLETIRNQIGGVADHVEKAA